MKLNDYVTPYAAGCLAIGKDRLWVDTHVEGKRIIEQDFNGKIIRWIPKPNPKGTVLTGLRWMGGDNLHMGDDRLMYTFGTWYEGKWDEPTIGVLWLRSLRHYVLPIDGPAALRRGGTMMTPYGVKFGFGGYYDRAADTTPSWGPYLSDLIGPYPIGERCPRPETYIADPMDWLGDGKTWAATDVIGGAKGAGGAWWIGSEAANGGPVFFVKLGTGILRYGDGGIQNDGWQYCMYRYKEVGTVSGNLEGPWITDHPYGDVRGVGERNGYLYGFISSLSGDDAPSIMELEI